MKPIAILEFPSNLGLKEPGDHHEPGVRKLPDWLRSHGFHELIHPSITKRLEPPPYSMDFDPESGVRNAGAIIRYASQQAGLLEQVLNEGYFPLVLGGDCSILLGNMLALKERGRYGLFYLDGHTDFVPPEFSHTGGAAGMDLSIVTGYGHDRLTNMREKKPYVREDWVWAVGNREYDESYVNLIRETRIPYYDLTRLRNEGIDKCVQGFQEMTRTEKLDGYWIHLDVDVLNDEIMPAVDSRTEDGLTYGEFVNLLEPLLKDPKLTGMEITILDPELDPDGVYTKEFISVMTGMINRIKA